MHEDVGRAAMLTARALGVGIAPLARRLATVRDRAVRPLIDGDAIMRLLDLKPGPAVRQATDLLIDAQTEGKIRSPAEAEAFLKDALS
jgi:hypothetical protein